MRKTCCIPRLAMQIALVATVLFAKTEFVGCSCVCAEEPRDFAKVVESLASPNPAPIIEEYNIKKVPDGYDMSAQKKVYAAWDTLLHAGTIAFPFVIAKYDDDRYCSTIESALSGAEHNKRVGEICREIIDGQITPCGIWTTGKGDPRSRPLRPSYCRTFLGDLKSAKQWWEEHKDKKLYEIQAEALGWLIAEEEKLADPVFKEDVQVLKGQLDKIKATKTPLEGTRHQKTCRYGTGECG